MLIDRARLLSHLLVVLPLLLSGCDREARPGSAGAPSLGVGEITAPSVTRQEGDLPEAAYPARGWWKARRPLVGEAMEALGAVITGEQVYYQKWVIFTVAADATELQSKMWVDLSSLTGRWDFAVHDANDTGFVASARGRDHTRAHEIVVILRYERGHPPSWSVLRQLPGHSH